MTLNNQNLMLLTKFALKAKSHIGIVKIAKMFNNELYAFDMLSQAALTGNQELIGLSQEINYEFQLEISKHLINAMESYIHNIIQMNTSDEFLNKSKYSLIKLGICLYGININGTSYRQAVEDFLSNVDNSEKTFSVNLARKFYRYWKASNRPLAECNQDETLKLINQKKAFIKLWDNLDYEFFSDIENWSLIQYAEFMFEKGYSEKDIIINSRIAKIITIEIRNEQSNLNNSYRDAIDRTQMLFEMEGLKNLSLVISREFYHFWLGNFPKKLSVV